jgi:two-component system response regulator NreC
MEAVSQLRYRCEFKMLKIVLIDDHEIFRLGLRSLLQAEPEIEIVGEAASGEEGLQVVGTTSPDLVVLDYAMPGISGLEITATLRKKHPSIRIIMLTASSSESVLSEALEFGAHGIMLKQDASAQLVEAIRTVCNDEKMISSSILPLLEKTSALKKLTKRERQVLRMIASGYRNREISEELNISLKTVDSHRTNLMRKLDLHRLVDVVEFANKIGILDPTI